MFLLWGPYVRLTETLPSLGWCCWDVYSPILLPLTYLCLHNQSQFLVDNIYSDQVLIFFSPKFNLTVWCFTGGFKPEINSLWSSGKPSSALPL